MKHLLTIISLFILFTACSKDDDSYEAPLSLLDVLLSSICQEITT